MLDDELDTKTFILNLNPALILIDTMMTGDGGLRMYSDLKHEENLKEVPVTVLCKINKKTCCQYLKIQKFPF